MGMKIILGIFLCLDATNLAPGCFKNGILEYQFIPVVYCILQCFGVLLIGFGVDEIFYRRKK